MSRLYDDVLLDHIRDARNYREMPDANRRGEAVSPLCGDTFQVFVRVEDDTVRDVSFQCECCGISMASASIMTDWIKGSRTSEALALKDAFVEAVTAHREALGIDAPADHTAVLRVVRATSGREGCATLAWQALSSALTGVAQIPVAGGEIHGDGTPADAA